MFDETWQLTNSWSRAQYLNLIGPGFLIFGLVFVSRNSEVGRNVSCEESTVKSAASSHCKWRRCFWKWPDIQLWMAHDLDLGSGHTAYCRASLNDLYILYLHAKFHWHRRNFLWTDIRTFETGFIRSTLPQSRPKITVCTFWRICVFNKIRMC